MKRLIIVIMAVCLLGGAGISEARYVDNGDGTVTDSWTSLIWQQATAPYLLTWDNAIVYCNNLTLAGHSDWRLPDRDELSSLVDRNYDPKIHPDYFPDTRSDWYWSSTTLATNYAWVVNFSSGLDSTDLKTRSRFVRAVRGGQAGSFGDLMIQIEPAEARNAGAQWRRTGTNAWRNSGTTEVSVPTGTHTVEFKDIGGWNTPGNITLTVNADQTATASGIYTQTQQTGSLRITIEPAEARNAGAQWRRTGTRTWRNSGATESNILVGTYTIEFKNISDWNTPANITVPVNTNQIATATGTYTQIGTYQPFPDTGQTKCYDNDSEITCPQPDQPFYGQDAQYQPRIPRSYTKLGMNGVELAADAAHVDDGGPWMMTRDNVTGLIWEIKTAANKDDTYNWQDAKDVFVAGLNASGFGGFRDWRLSEVGELSSLVNAGVFNPAVDVEWFPNTRSVYWSATTSANYTNGAWRVDFGYGYVYNYLKASSYYVRAVRAGQSWSSDNLIINGDGTVTDPDTGLLWQEDTAPDTYTWQEALEYAENLTLAGYSDWRLPNRNELQSLVDYSRFNPAIKPALAGKTYSSGYWSSTTNPANTVYAWSVRFASGGVTNTEIGSKSQFFTPHVRAVRGGHSHISSFGSLVISIEPAEARNAGAQWRRTNTTAWRNSGDTETNVPTGTHAVEFKNVDGWTKPTNITLTIDADKTTTATGTYTQTKQTGLLRITVEPSEARNAGAQWRRTGTTTWRDSGTTETNIPLGTYTVEFKDVEGWNKPANITLNINADQTSTATGTYTKTKQTGSLQITIEPAEARNAGAQWRRKGTSTWRDSGATEISVPTGTHTVEFKDIGGWNTPGNTTVNINANQTTTATGTYAQIGAYQPIPDTGQSTCYNNSNEIACPHPAQPFYGQDANYTINPMSYTKLDASGNELLESVTAWAMVRDNVTGLIWEGKTTSNKDLKYTWDEAHAYVANLRLGGHSDWRLPTINEMINLIDYSIPHPGPTINTFYFPNTLLGAWYWSSVASAHYTGYAWLVGFSSGYDANSHDSERFSVRAVRGRQSDIGYFQGNGTVTDTVTGLMWQQISPSYTMTWQQALSYCERLALGGYTDWRLPTIKELGTLVDHSQSAPTINITYFPDTIASLYWSSTTSVLSTSNAWNVDFSFGNSTNSSKAGSRYVRAVRGGQSAIGSFGHLIISIDPAEARTAGAQWKRTGTTAWYNSGDSETNVPTGTHTVEFKDISGWRKPTDITVSINEDQTATATVTYTVLSNVLINDDLSININCLDFFSDKYSMIFNYVNGFMWELNVNSIAAAQTGRCQSIDDGLNIYITCADIAGEKLGFTLMYDIRLSWELDVESLRGMTTVECN